MTKQSKFIQTLSVFLAMLIFEKNLQGDVIGIYNASGTKVASYTYDAWGNLVDSSYVSGFYNVYTYNPFRYRGYYYDAESGFYYLQSRYYDPATGRFLNADGYVNANGDLIGFNMYAYCSNNPVMNVDLNGDFPWLIIAIVAVAVIGIPTAINHIVNGARYDSVAEATSDLDKEAGEKYPTDISEQKINNILSKYNTSDIDQNQWAEATIHENHVEIKNSYRVTSRYDREMICEILANTVGFEREYDHLAAEWLGHNIAYRINPFANQDSSSAHADLELIKDPRWYYRVATKILEIWGWE